MTIEALRHRMLKAMLPAHDEEPPAKWQQRKSAQTRQRLIEAGIDCLVEGGYARLTTAAVAERCEVSRGAMHHHFPTRMDLVAAVVEYVFYQRMDAFIAESLAAIHGNGLEKVVELASELHWSSIHGREYAAYLELTVAARTDAELAEHFVPAARRFDELWTSEMIGTFPQWQTQLEAMKLASDLTMVAQMGMLLHEPVFGTGERMQRLRSYVTRVVRQLYES